MTYNSGATSVDAPVTPNHTTLSEVAMAIKDSIRSRPPRKSLIGQRFGRLVVQAWAGTSRWVCLCDCGKTAHVITANLNRGNTASCGCMRNISSSKRATKHGLSNTKAYKSWVSIKRRCLEPSNSSYKDYGAKGITIFDDWINDPVAFCQYIGPCPTEEHSVDRVDNSKGYAPGNIRWATPTEQANNRSTNRWVTFQGKRYTLTQLARYIAEECGITEHQFKDALRGELIRV